VSDRYSDAACDPFRDERRSSTRAGDDRRRIDDLPATRRGQSMGAQVPVDARDRDPDRAGSGVQDAADRACRALVKRLDPEPSERDAERRGTGNKNGKAKWPHDQDGRSGSGRSAEPS